MTVADKRLKALDKRLQGIYDAAYKTAIKRQEKAIAKLAAFDADALRAQGLDETAIRTRKLMHMRTVDRETRLVNSIAAEIARAGETAAKIIKGEMLNVYQDSYGGALLSVDEQLGFSVDWSVYDRNQLKVLLDSEEAPFTKVAYKKLGSDRIAVGRLQNALTQSVLLGEGVPEIARRVRDVTGQSVSQARTVARTEALRVSNQGRMIGFKQAHDEYGIEMEKQWIATLDSRTRDSHADLHMEKVALDERFSNGLMQPGDSSGGPEEVINCRCAVVSVLKGFKGSKAYQELNERIGKERIYEARDAAKTERQETRADFASLVGVKTSTGVAVKNAFGHIIDRSAERGVSVSAIKDALQKPLNVGKIRLDEKGRERQTFIGAKATVGINPKTGKITTTYATSSRRRKKYGGG